MVGLFAESSRDHRRHGFLYRADCDLPVLYCFFVIEHERRKILHCNVTQHPTAEWIVQQLREAFPEPCRHQYVILDRDRKFDTEVLAFLAAAGVNAKRTSVRAPWQSGLAERWIESCRREILDHVIALNEEHLRRILGEYVRYHHQDRLHDSLEKDAPNRRIVEQRPGGDAKVVSMSRWVRLDYITVTLRVRPRRRKSRFSGRAEHRCLV